MPRLHDFHIINFGAGYAPNAGDTPTSRVSARVWENFRLTQDNYLTPRGGSARANGIPFAARPETVFKGYFLRQNNADRRPLFVVTDEILYSEDDINFFSFSPALSQASGERKFDHHQYEKWVMVGNGRGEQYTIDIEQTPPVARNFYVETPATPALALAAGGSVDTGFHLYAIVNVVEESGIPVAFSPPSTKVNITVTAGNQTVDVSNILDPTDAQVTHKYIYRTNTGALVDGIYRFVAKIAVGGGTTYSDTVADSALPADLTLNNGIMLTSQSPNWRYGEIASQRFHVVEEDSDVLYLSFFDGSSEVYIRNFSNQIQIGSGDEPITAIKSLAENQIVAFTPSRIYNIYTDPIVESYVVRPANTGGSPGHDETVGCVADRSAVRMRDGVYFLDPRKRVTRFDGSTPTWVSAKVQPDLNKIPNTRVSQPVGWADGNLYYLAFPTQDGANNEVLIYDTAYNRWFHDTGVQIADAFVARNTGQLNDDRGEMYTCMGSENHIRVYETGADDAGAPVACKWKSNPLRAGKKSGLHHVSVRTRGAATLTVTADTPTVSKTSTLTPTSGDDLFRQRAGFTDVNNREIQVGVETATQGVVIDAIIANEKYVR